LAKLSHVYRHATTLHVGLESRLLSHELSRLLLLKELLLLLSHRCHRLRIIKMLLLELLLQHLLLSGGIEVL